MEVADDLLGQLGADVVGEEALGLLGSGDVNVTALADDEDVNAADVDGAGALIGELGVGCSVGDGVDGFYVDLFAMMFGGDVVDRGGGLLLGGGGEEFAVVADAFSRQRGVRGREERDARGEEEDPSE